VLRTPQRSDFPPAPARRRHRAARRRRKQPYGVSKPGDYSAIPAWRSRERWRSECYPDLHTHAVAELRRKVGKRGPVSIKACWALAHALSACADTATGRNAMPGTVALTAKPAELDLDDLAVLAQMEASTGYGKTTLQKAAAVLAARGWIVLVRAGKNWLREEERKELWRAGSAARKRRNVWACTIPKHPRSRRRPEAAETLVPAQLEAHPSADEHGPVDNAAREPASAELGCDLPTTRRVKWVSLVPEQKVFKPNQASKTAPSGRPPTKEAARKRTYQADWRTVRLAKDLRARIYWLRDVPHQRIMPALDRFARAGWTARDVQRELDTLLARLGWEVPCGRTTTTSTGREHRYPLRSPWGYLAMLLRCLEPTDLAAEREYEQAMREAEHRYQELLRNGPECPHGQPGGLIRSPRRAIMACPLCRRDGRP